MAFITPYVTDKSVTYKGDARLTLLSAAIWLIDDFTKKEAIGHIKVVIKEANIRAIKNLSGYYIFTDRGNYTVDVSSDLYFPPEDKVMVDTPILNFDTNGPASGETRIKLKDVSKLQEDDIVEFYNRTGDIEQKNLARIDSSEKTILWVGGLKCDFTAKGSTILALKKNPVVPVLLKPLPSYPFPYNATLVRGVIFDSNERPVNKATVIVIGQEVEAQSDENGEFVLYFNVINDANVVIQIRYNEMIKTMNSTLEKNKIISIGKIVLS